MARPPDSPSIFDQERQRRSRLWWEQVQLVFGAVQDVLSYGLVGAVLVLAGVGLAGWALTVPLLLAAIWLRLGVVTTHLWVRESRAENDQENP